MKPRIVRNICRPDAEAIRERVIEWYRSTLVTRPDDKQVARIVLVMQRIHIDDLVGYLLDNDAGFEVLNFQTQY